MNIRDYSPQFTVFIYMDDINVGAAAKVALSRAGYDVYFIQDREALEERLRQSPPHILVFATAAVSGELDEFISNIQNINDDVKFIAVSSVDQFSNLVSFGEHIFSDIVPVTSLNMESHILWSVDRCCERLFLTYQNEQLFDELSVLRTKKEKTEKVEAMAQTPEVPVSGRIVEYRSTESKEDLIQRFLDHVENNVCIYFKYLPSLRSFVATHVKGIVLGKIEGIGVQLEPGELKDLGGLLAMGILPPAFLEMLREGFAINTPRVRPLYSNNVFEGLFIFSSQFSEHEFSLMVLCYENFTMEKRLDAIEIRDSATELYNLSYYKKVLVDEIARSRRLSQPVSLLKMSLNNYEKIRESVGESGQAEIFKSIAVITQKTSRTNDIVSRTGENEISMILPHCSKKGATIRAERLRRIIEGTTFLDHGMRVFVSLGVSEYPTLCDSEVSLDSGAAKALLHITEKGISKVCLYKAPESHHPDFEVPIE